MEARDISAGLRAGDEPVGGRSNGHQEIELYSELISFSETAEDQSPAEPDEFTGAKTRAGKQGHTEPSAAEEPAVAFVAFGESAGPGEPVHEAVFASSSTGPLSITGSLPARYMEITGKEAVQVVCSTCGAKSNSQELFCSACGSFLEDEQVNG